MPILHSVFFYMHEDVSEQKIQAQKQDILTELIQIPGVSNLHAGSPFGIDRDVVDNSYGLSLHLIVDDKDALEAYQSHELHQAFIAKHKPNWKSIRVFDTLI